LEKKAVTPTTFISILLLSALAATAFVNLANADPVIQWRFDASPIITIQSPENNKTYSPDNFILVFNLTKPTANLGGYPYRNNWFEPIQGSIYGNDFGNRVVNATYYIDGQPSNVSIEVNSQLLSSFNYSLPLNSLTDGRHSLQLCLFCNGVEGWIWAAAGSLHYCNYVSYSEIVNFSFSTPPPETPPSPPFTTAILVAVIVIVIIVVSISLGLLIHLFKKRKHAPMTDKVQ
jgi:hypothetical protein